MGGGWVAMTWARMLADFHEAMIAAGRSPATIRLYRYRLQDLAEVVASPVSVTTDDLVHQLACPTWKPETRKNVRTAFRTFFRWAYKTGRVPTDPAAALDTVRVPAGVPRPAPEDVVRAALAETDPTVALMIRLAAFAGLRASEVARVHSSHLVGDVLLVLGKGGKTRAVPLVPEVLDHLRGVHGYAFPNRWTGEPMTAGHVTKLVSAALPDGWTCHTLRHRMASVSYAGCRDLLAVGALLGHSRPETTQRYVRLPDDALRAAIGHVSWSPAP